MPSTPLANDSAHTTMSWCRCTQPFGAPVLPEEYSQNAASSLLVGAAGRFGEPFAIRSASVMSPALSDGESTCRVSGVEGRRKR